jgi:hypothetical protein
MKKPTSNTIYSLHNNKAVLSSFVLVAFVVFLIRMPELSYWWDEWTILESATDQPFHGLFVNHMGHFFPLGRLFFLVQVELFGPHYIWLIITNFFLVLAICLKTFSILCQIGLLNKNQLFVFYPLIALYLMTEGVQYDVQWGFQIAWLLSVLFALFTTQELLNPTVRLTRLVPYFLLTWLSLGSNLPLVALLISAFVLTTQKTYFLKRVNVMLILNGAAVCLTFLGMEIAKRNNPTDSTAIGSQLDLVFVLTHLVEILKIAIVMATSWLIAPLTIVVPSGFINFEGFAEYLQDNFVLALFLFSSMLFIALQISRSQVNHGRMVLFPGSIFISLYFSCLVVALGRYGNFGSFFHVRYGPVFSLYSFLYWIAIFRCTHLKKTKRNVVINQGLAGVVLATCLFSVLVFPWTLKSASFPGRIYETGTWVNNLKQCRSSEQIEVLRAIQPVMDGGRVCRIAKSLELIP